MNLGVLTGLDYYIFMYKLKSALNISYDVTLSTDIIVLTQNKSFYHSFYV